MLLVGGFQTSYRLRVTVGWLVLGVVALNFALNLIKTVILIGIAAFRWVKVKIGFEVVEEKYRVEVFGSRSEECVKELNTEKREEKKKADVEEEK